MAIFSFLARLGLDTTQFESGIKRAQSSAAGFGKSLKGHVTGEIRGLGASLAGMFTLGAVRNFASSITEMVGDIKDMSDLLEISTDDVQKLQKAAADAGQPFSRVVNALQKIEAARAQAMTGDEKATGIFSMLGIDPTQGGSLDILKAAIEASKRGAVENAVAFELLGTKVGNVKAVIDELKQQGPIEIISKDQIDKLDAASKRLEEAMRMTKIQAAPALGGAMDELNKLLAWNNELARINKALPFLMASGPLGGLFFGAGAAGFNGGSQSVQQPISATPSQAPAAQSKMSDQDAAIQLLRQMNENTRRTAEVLETNAER